MKDFLKVHQVTLDVIGPVFVGSGAEISKKEYVFLDGNSKIGVIDIKKMYEFASRKGLRTSFEDMMLNQRADLHHWLMDNRINKNEIKPVMRYVLESGQTSLQRGTRVQIMEAVKDPYGQPYIPGSSLKGMLRTILLCGRVQREPNRYTYEKRTMESAADRPTGRQRYLLKEQSEIEQKAFYLLSRDEKKRGNAVNDELSGLLVSDSEPLKISDLILCQKVERHTDGTEKTLNLLRECIRPGTKIRFTISIDQTICSVTADEIKDALAYFEEIYNDCFLNAFRGIDRIVPGTVYLGGGAGYVSKTVTYPLFGKHDGLQMAQTIFETTVGRKGEDQHQHRKDHIFGASPHIVKCTHVDGRSVQMGQCRLSIS